MSVEMNEEGDSFIGEIKRCLKYKCNFLQYCDKPKMRIYPVFFNKSLYNY